MSHNSTNSGREQSDQEDRRALSGLARGHGWPINTTKLCLHTHTDNHTLTHMHKCTHTDTQLDPSCQPSASENCTLGCADSSAPHPPTSFSRSLSPSNPSRSLYLSLSLFLSAPLTPSPLSLSVSCLPPFFLMDTPRLTLMHHCPLTAGCHQSAHEARPLSYLLARLNSVLSGSLRSSNMHLYLLVLWPIPLKINYTI